MLWIVQFVFCFSSDTIFTLMDHASGFMFHLIYYKSELIIIRWFQTRQHWFELYKSRVNTRSALKALKTISQSWFCCDGLAPGDFESHLFFCNKRAVCSRNIPEKGLWTVVLTPYQRLTAVYPRLNSFCVSPSNHFIVFFDNYQR